MLVFCFWTYAGNFWKFQLYLQFNVASLLVFHMTFVPNANCVGRYNFLIRLFNCFDGFLFGRCLVVMVSLVRFYIRRETLFGLHCDLRFQCLSSLLVVSGTNHITKWHSKKTFEHSWVRGPSRHDDCSLTEANSLLNFECKRPRFEISVHFSREKLK